MFSVDLSISNILLSSTNTIKITEPTSQGFKITFFRSNTNQYHLRRVVIDSQPKRKEWFLIIKAANIATQISVSLAKQMKITNTEMKN